MTGSGQKWLTGTVVVLAVAALAWLWLRQTRPISPTSVPGKSPVLATPNVGDSLESNRAQEQMLHSSLNELVAGKTADAKSQALSRLRQVLETHNTNEMSAAIRRLLDSKTDAATGQGFKIGANGFLTEVPSLRTFLLDQLAMIDPAGAAAYARAILNTSDSPDEWAVALRNLARGDASPDARALIEAKTGELLRNESWQLEPSVGYLEAFDTAVYLGGTDLLLPLSDLVRRKDNQAVAHAAFLTLDRLVINQSAETLATLNEHPEWMTGREETRANYFARADVGDAEQRRLVESYLLEASRSAAELQAFAGVFPNANFMISHNLLTGNVTLDGATLARRDREALRVVGEWLSDPQFETPRPHLLKIQQRLQEFNRQREGAR